MRPLVHHGDPIGERHRFGLVVRDVDHRRAGALVEARELLFHRCAQMHVEIGERLVEQHQRRLGDEAARECDALALAARQQCGAPVAEAVELDQRERRVDATRALRILDAGDGRARTRRSARRSCAATAHTTGTRCRCDAARAATDATASTRRVSPIRMRPASGSVEAGDLPQQRRLAAARRAEDRDELAVVDVERHVVERAKLAERACATRSIVSRAMAARPAAGVPASSSVDSISAMLTATVSTPSAAA